MKKGKKNLIKLEIDSKAGFIRIDEMEQTIEITTERFNELNSNIKWELLDIYTKNDLRTTLWKNKETGEEKESIGTHPPSEILNIKQLIKP